MAATPDGKGYWTATSIKVPPRTCQTSQLSLATDPAHSSGGAAGSLGITYDFTNTLGDHLHARRVPGPPTPQRERSASDDHDDPARVRHRPPSRCRPPDMPGSTSSFPRKPASAISTARRPVHLPSFPPTTPRRCGSPERAARSAPYGGSIPHLMCGNINTSPVLAQPPF